jgi:hypothetical protein
MNEIKTHFVYPPIPLRCYDWCAYVEGYEPGNTIGYGRTEAEAIEDLKNQLNFDSQEADV